MYKVGNKEFASIHELNDWLKERVAHWNNFESGSLEIKIEKEDEESLSISVSEDIDTGDLFGKG